jgi:antibiotic biosynthesis monooxygenase (ABM) superfamily enzyme
MQKDYDYVAIDFVLFSSSWFKTALRSHYHNHVLIYLRFFAVLFSMKSGKSWFAGFYVNSFNPEQYFLPSTVCLTVHM